MAQRSRALSGLTLAMTAVAACAILVALDGARTVAFRRTAATPRTVSENEAAARSEAASLLSATPLPPGASSSPTEPSGDDSLLASPFSYPATPNLVDDHAWWTVPGSRVNAVAYLHAHVPAGARTAGSGEGGGPGGTDESVTFAWRPIKGVLASRELTVGAVQLADGSTALRVDAEVVWTTPRPPSEVIPPGARLLRIVVHNGLARRRTRPRPLVVASAKKIDAIAGLLNALPAAQPGIRNCPADFGISVRLVFLARRHAAPLAAADVATTGCEGVSLTIGGRAQPALEGGETLIRQVDHVLGVNLDIARHGGGRQV